MRYAATGKTLVGDGLLQLPRQRFRPTPAAQRRPRQWNGRLAAVRCSRELGQPLAIEVQITLAAIAYLAKGLKVLEECFSSLGPRQHMINFQDDACACGRTDPAKPALKPVSTHYKKPQSPRR